MNEIKNWDFWKDQAIDDIAPRQALTRQTVCRFKEYLKVKDDRCTGYKKKLKKRRFPTPLIDEQIWTFLVAYGYRQNPALLFEKLTGMTHPDPTACRAWLEMLPMPSRRGGGGQSSEGNSNIDLIAGSIARRGETESGVQYWPVGPVCLLEAKWKSDIAGYTSHDPHRNQLARVIETAVTLQYHAADKNGLKNDSTEFGAMPNDVYVTLLTPATFKASAFSWSRFYAYKFHEYDEHREALLSDIQRQDEFGVKKRTTEGWKYPEKEIRSRLEKVQLRWVTYEDLLAAMPDTEFRSAMAAFVARPESCLLDRNIFPGEGV